LIVPFIFRFVVTHFWVPTKTKYKKKYMIKKYSEEKKNRSEKRILECRKKAKIGSGG
jgi:hypothetical protein